MSSLKVRTIDDVVEALKNNQENRNSCVLLVGAGCSVTAGIPTAAGIVEIIRTKYPSAHARARAPKTYSGCMAELTIGQRRGLIRSIISASAQLNWAHIGIAQLVKAKYVDRVLTVNFDPLLMRACAVADEYPAIYDFAAQHDYSSDRIADRAIFHLHGQHTGFVILNTEKEVEDQAERVRRVMHDSGQRRTWIIVGYSGDNDPVFQVLAGLSGYDHALFWIGYKDSAPSEHAQKLLARENAYHVPGYDADSFFVKLCQNLGCFPPSLVGRPFSYLMSILDTFTAFPAGEFDILSNAKQSVQSAIETAENARLVAPPGDRVKTTASVRLQASELYAKGDFDALRAVADQIQVKDEEVTDLVSWSYTSEGLRLAADAAAKQGEEADNLFALAYEKYDRALAIKHDKHEALNNWGLALFAQAMLKTGAEADRLFAAAGEKYQQALTIKPDKHGALYNWGNVLYQQAKLKTGAEADRLFAAAYEKYERALEIKPNMQAALYNWGVALWEQAKLKTGAEADRLFAGASEKYERALAIKPDMHEALHNWGIALNHQAKLKTGAEADRLFAAAGEKYQQALTIKPDDRDSLYNWGNALGNQAKLKSGVESDRLFAAAYEKYERALAIKQDNHDALNGWGNALLEQAKLKTGAEADRLFAAAYEKYERALALKPDMREALNGWGAALTNQAATKEGAERKRILIKATELISRAYRISRAESAYNMACISSLAGDTQQAVKYLRESWAARKLPSREHLLADVDLAAVRQTAEFEAFDKEAFGQAAGNIAA